MMRNAILLFKSIPPSSSIAAATALLGSGLCMGLGAIGPSLGEGFTASNAVKWIARSSESTAEITRVMIIGQAITESTGIYALLIALILLFII